MYQPGANTEFYLDARLACYETKTTRCGSSTRLNTLLRLEIILNKYTHQPGAKIGLARLSYYGAKTMLLMVLYRLLQRRGGKDGRG